jgi:hypothetical protein
MPNEEIGDLRAEPEKGLGDQLTAIATLQRKVSELENDINTLLLLFENFLALISSIPRYSDSQNVPFAKIQELLKQVRER